jgi:hypothetical protein
MIVPIPRVLSDDQVCQVGKECWRVAGLIARASKMPVMEIPLAALTINVVYEESLREMVGHFKLIEKADLESPIILDQDGIIMDGQHRVMKAIFDGLETIKAVRFEENPPCDWSVEE